MKIQNRWKVIVGKVAATAILLAGSPFVTAAGSVLCQGTVYNPLTETNWNNAFPITIGGIRIGAGSNPPLMHMPPICMCPGPNGVPIPGIGMTYWEPAYVAEIARTPGCLSTLGGQEALPGFEFRTSNQSMEDGDKGGEGTTNMEVHWYQYPLYSVLNLMGTLGCMNSGGYNLADLTEVDPTWSNSAWSAVAFPETALYASFPMIAACIPDSISSTAGLPLDMMNWCAGNKTIYPLVGWSDSYFPQSGNLHVLAKYMARKTRFAGLLSTIGPWATCSSIYLPNLIRSQYRIDPIAPVPLNRKVVLGMSSLRWGFTPPANTPTRSDSAYLIWVGKQCCAL